MLVFLQLIIIFYYFKKNVIDKADPTGFLSSGSPFAFPKVWLTVSYYSGCILILPSLLLLMLVTNEFTYRTSRQNIIDGLSRKQFIEVKLMSGAILALASTVLVFFTALIFGFVVGGDFSLEGIENLAYFFLKGNYVQLCSNPYQCFGKTHRFCHCNIFYLHCYRKWFVSVFIWLGNQHKRKP